MKLQRILDGVEKAGNKLPNPTILFIVLCLAILILSAIAALFSLQAIHPINGNSILAINLISVDGLHRILTESVKNFTSFAPVGTVLVAIMGIGVAEHSGLLGTLLRATVLKTPKQLLTFTVVLAGILSSLAADTGYVVLIPLAGLIFASVGRNPIAGIAAAFAGVSGGYSANLLIGPLDAILAGISTEAATLIQDDYVVSAAGNYYFMVVSTLLVALIGTWVTEKIICVRLPDGDVSKSKLEPISESDIRGLKAIGFFTLLFVCLLLVGLVPESGILRDQDTQSILRSPFISGIVTIIAFYAAVAGIIFGRVSGRYKRTSEFVEGMEQHMATMAGYLVLMFFAAQFVSYFSWSNLGSIIAINGAAMLQAMQMNSSVLLMAFIIMAALINLFIGSASAKWALIAPVFVPMLLLSGITPEATQIAYRIGDSSTNIITPLMPYFGVVVAFAQKYDKNIGIGTIIAMMLPFSIAFLFSWSILLMIWIFLGWPLGPGAGVMI
ncbi:MAG: AbgT family transporter [Gammaproteobacteria bacterium]|jgi:aminobenzoyl-glutamate transport protein